MYECKFDVVEFPLDSGHLKHVAYKLQTGYSLSGIVSEWYLLFWMTAKIKAEAREKISTDLDIKGHCKKRKSRTGGMRESLRLGSFAMINV